MKYVGRKKLTYVDYKCSRTVGPTIPHIYQLLYYYGALI